MCLSSPFTLAVLKTFEVPPACEHSTPLFGKLLPDLVAVDLAPAGMTFPFPSSPQPWCLEEGAHVATSLCWAHCSLCSLLSQAPPESLGEMSQVQPPFDFPLPVDVCVYGLTEPRAVTNPTSDTFLLGSSCFPLSLCSGVTPKPLGKESHNCLQLLL